MKVVKYFLAFIVLAGMLSGCTFNGSEAIFTVNGRKVTQADYDKTYEKNLKNPIVQILAAGGDKMASKSRLVAKENTVSELIWKKLAEEQIEKRKITVSKKELDTVYKRAVENVGGEKQWKELLEKGDHKLSNADAREILREGLLREKLFKEFSSKEEANSYFLSLRDKAEIIYIDKSYNLEDIQKEVGWKQPTGKATQDKK